MFGRNKEQSLGDMLKSPEAPKPVEAKAEMSFDDWDKKAAAKGEWAAKKAGELKDKAKQLWGGLKNRVKKGAGWVMSAPEIAGYAAGKAKEAVSEKMVEAGNVDYDRKTAPEGGKVENFLASLDEKRDEITARYDQAYNKFAGFLKYHSPAARRERATEEAQRQVESLQTERAVTNMTAQELMAALKNCEKLGVPVTGIKVEIGNPPPSENYKERRSKLAKAA